MKKELLLFFAIVGLFGFASGMSENVINNFFFDAYNVDPVQRGLLEIPREMPGVLAFLVIALASPIGDVRLSMLAQILCIIGMSVLGFFTPPYAIMVMFVFVHSMGSHLFFPLQDSIALSIIGDKDVGKRMGQYGSIRTACAMVASIIIFIGFRAGVFSFVTQLKMPFVIGVIGFISVFAMLLLLYKKYNVVGEARKKKFEIIIKKEYKFYYILAILTGVHRQIIMVFGTWVLVQILRQQADTMSLLGIVSAFFGAIMLPAVGRLIDRLGTKKILLTEGLLFIILYAVFGFMSGGFSSGMLSLTGIPLFVFFGMFIADRLVMQLGIVRSIYLRSIVTDPADITPTLATGLSMDHVVSIAFASISGVVWNALGPQYVFYTAATLSIINVVVAILIKQDPPSSAPESPASA